MKVAMMNPLTKRELAALRTPTKNELIAYVRNELQVVILKADFIATDTSEDPKTEAHEIAKSARVFLSELEGLFQVDRNGHLGGEAESV